MQQRFGVRDPTKEKQRPRGEEVKHFDKDLVWDEGSELAGHGVKELVCEENICVSQHPSQLLPPHPHSQEGGRTSR